MKLQTRVALAGIAFPIVVLASSLLRKSLDDGLALQAVTLAPLLPAAVLGWLGFEHMRSRDEMHRRIQLEGAAFAFAVTLAATMTWLFVNAAYDIAAPSPATYVLLLGGSWLAGLLLSWRRYCGG